MTKFSARIEIRGLDGLADPEGQTIERALPALGFAGIEGVRVGKLVRLHIEADDERAAQETVQRLCDRLLANPVIERADFTIDHAGSHEPAAGWGPV